MAANPPAFSFVPAPEEQVRLASCRCGCRRCRRPLDRFGYFSMYVRMYVWGRPRTAARSFPFWRAGLGLVGGRPPRKERGAPTLPAKALAYQPPNICSMLGTDGDFSCRCTGCALFPARCFCTHTQPPSPSSNLRFLGDGMYTIPWIGLLLSPPRLMI